MREVTHRYPETNGAGGQGGAQHIEAIPSPDRANFDLKWAADRYRDLLHMGRERGITTAFEFVGFLKGIHRLGQAAAVALDANDQDACLVADTFHTHRGGSGFNGIRHLNGNFIAVFHWNDVPTFDAEALKRLPGAAIRWVLRDERICMLNIGISMPIDIDMNVETFKADMTLTDSDSLLLADYCGKAYENPMVKKLPVS